MAFDIAKPNGEDPIGASDNDLRENFRALIEDTIINAGYLNGHPYTDFLLKDGSVKASSILTYLNTVSSSADADIPSFKNVKDYITSQYFLKKDGSITATSLLTYFSSVTATQDTHIPSFKNIKDLADTKLSSTDTSVTKQGNDFNGNSQLICTTSDGKYPALDGSLITNLTSDTAGKLVPYSVNFGPIKNLIPSLLTFNGNIVKVPIGIGAISESLQYTETSANTSYYLTASKNLYCYATSGSTVDVVSWTYKGNFPNFIQISGGVGVGGVTGDVYSLDNQFLWCHREKVKKPVVI